MKIKEYNIYTPSFFWVVDMNFSQDYLDKLATTIRNIKDVQDYKTNVKGKMSSWQLWDHSPVFNHLFGKVDDALMEVIPDGYRLHGKRHSLTTYEAWSAVYHKDDYANPHWHAASILSWVFYVKADPHLDSPLALDCLASAVGQENLIPSISNRLIIFPGTLGHSVKPQEHESERIVIAGNAGFREI